MNGKPLAYRRWRRDELSFSIIDGMSGEGIVTIMVETPDGAVSFMGEVAIEGTVLIADGVHVSSGEVAPNAIGIGNLRLIAMTIMREMGYDSIRVQGAVRTTGANPGHRPRPIRFNRGRDDPDGT